MSRSLGANVRRKARHQDNSYETLGRQMFERGEPCPPNVRTRGKDHAKWRGWTRAAAAARTAQANRRTP